MAYENKNPLYRTKRGAKLGGVCAGLSEYFRIDVTIIRILFVLFGIVFGSALFLYILLFICLPQK